VFQLKFGIVSSDLLKVQFGGLDYAAEYGRQSIHVRKRHVVGNWSWTARSFCQCRF